MAVPHTPCHFSGHNTSNIRPTKKNDVDKATKKNHTSHKRDRHLTYACNQSDKMCVRVCARVHRHDNVSNVDRRRHRNADMHWKCDSCLTCDWCSRFTTSLWLFTMIEDSSTTHGSRTKKLQCHESRSCRCFSFQFPSTPLKSMIAGPFSMVNCVASKPNI